MMDFDQELESNRHRINELDAETYRLTAENAALRAELLAAKARAAIQLANTLALSDELAAIREQKPVAWRCWVDADMSQEYQQLCSYEPTAFKFREPLYPLKPENSP